MRIFCASVFALAVMTASPAPAQVVDLSTIKCQEFVNSGQETIGYIMMWLDGYYTTEDDPAVINFEALKGKGEKLGAYCGSNPTHGLLTAAEEIMSK
jgi:acid stress chaperone HdeB